MSLFSSPKAGFHLSSARTFHHDRVLFGRGQTSPLRVLQNDQATNNSVGLPQDVFECPARRDTVISWADEQRQHSLIAKLLQRFIPANELLDDDVKQWIVQISGNKKLMIQGEALNEQQKKFYIQQLKKLHEVVVRAQKNKTNPSNNYYGTALETGNGELYSAINTEADAETTHCDLRNATILALMDKAKTDKDINQSVEKTKEPWQESQVPNKVKIRTLFLVNADFHGEPPIPCSDCQNWMTTPTFSPDTKVVSLEKENQTGTALMRIRTVAQMLPLHQGREPVRMTTAFSLKALPIVESNSANRTQKHAAQRLSEAQMRDLLQLAQNQYEQSADCKKFPAAGVAVLLEGKQGTVMEGMGSRHWSRTYQIPFDESCVAAAESKYANQYAHRKGESGIIPDKPTLKAIAYYGEEPKLPPIRSLGHLIRRQAPGTLNTFILTVENDAIHCRTASDFIKEAYKAENN